MRDDHLAIAVFRLGDTAMATEFGVEAIPNLTPTIHRYRINYTNLQSSKQQLQQQNIDASNGLSAVLEQNFPAYSNPISGIPWSYKRSAASQPSSMLL